MTLIRTIVDTEYTIEIWQSKKTRWMTFGNGNIQSAMNLANPHHLVLNYMPTMLGALHFNPNINHCCLLGLGGAAIVRFLQHDYPHIKLTTVEINPQIIEVAKGFFYLPQPSDLFNLVCTDAIHYIAETDQRFDLMLVDLYNADDLPQGLSTEEFYRQCQKKLTPNGILACNLLCKSQQQLKQIIYLIRTVFSHRTLCIEVAYHSNIIIYAFNDGSYTKMITEFTSTKIIRGVKLDMELGVIAKSIQDISSLN